MKSLEQIDQKQIDQKQIDQENQISQNNSNPMWKSAKISPKISPKISLSELKEILQHPDSYFQKVMLANLQIPKITTGKQTHEKIVPKLVCKTIWQYLTYAEIAETRLLNKEFNNAIKESLQSDNVRAVLLNKSQQGIDKADMLKVMEELTKNATMIYNPAEVRKATTSSWNASRSWALFGNKIQQGLDKNTIEKIISSCNDVAFQKNKPNIFNQKDGKLSLHSQIILKEILDHKFGDYIQNSPDPEQKLFWNFLYKAGFDKVKDNENGIGLNASGIGRILQKEHFTSYNLSDNPKTIEENAFQLLGNKKWNDNDNNNLEIPISSIKSCLARDFLGQDDLDITLLDIYFDKLEMDDLKEMIKNATKLFHYKILTCLELDLHPSAWQLLESYVENKILVNADDVLTNIVKLGIKDHTIEPRGSYFDQYYAGEDSDQSQAKINIDHDSFWQMLQAREAYLKIPSRAQIEEKIANPIIKQYISYIDFFQNPHNQTAKKFFEETLKEVFLSSSALSIPAYLDDMKNSPPLEGNDLAFPKPSDELLTGICYSYLQNLPGHFTDSFVRPISNHCRYTHKSRDETRDIKKTIPLKDLKTLVLILLASGESTETLSNFLNVSFGLKYNCYVTNHHIERVSEGLVEKYAKDEKMIYEALKYIKKLITNIASDILDPNLVKQEERPDYAVDQSMDTFEHAIQVVLDRQANGDVKMPPQDLQDFL